MSSNIVVRHGTDLREDEVVRYTLVERMCHWVAGLSYLYVLATGLALFTPYLYWLAYVLGGGPTIRFWHPWVGLIFVAATWWMHSLWHDDMKTTKDDLEWRKTVKAYVTNDDGNVAPAGHFNSAQKQFYWIMFYGALVLLITGIVMWFPELMPRGPTGCCRSWSSCTALALWLPSAPSSSMFIWVSFSSRADSTVSFTAVYQPRGSKPITVSGMTRQ